MNRFHVVETNVDIDNPHVDRRSKDWNRLPIIPAGSRFIVGGDTIRSSEHRYAFEGGMSELGKLIGTHSRVVEPKSVKELASVYDCDFGGDEILRVLLKLGRITPADFEAVAKAIEEEDA